MRLCAAARMPLASMRIIAGSLRSVLRMPSICTAATLACSRHSRSSLSTVTGLPIDDLQNPKCCYPESDVPLVERNAGVQLARERLDRVLRHVDGARRLMREAEVERRTRFDE